MPDAVRRALADRLADAVGRDAVRTGDAPERWAVYGRAPAAVVAPSSSEQAAEALALASREGWRVEPAGAGAALSAGRPAAAPDVVITTVRLDEVVEYEPADLTAAVGAGLSISALRDRLAAHGQWLPLDPPARSDATIGAVVATAAAGPLRLGHGTPRDHLLGTELVTGDGRVLAFGGRVVKNVAGYDLTRAVVGSHGTLGLVTRVNIRLRPLPERDATLVLDASEPGPLVDVVAAIRDARLDPAALELLSPPVARRTLREARPDDRWALLVRIQGNAEAARDVESRAAELAAGAAVRTPDPDEASGAWRRLGALEAESPVAVRFADRPARLAATLALATEALRAAAEDTGPAGVPLTAHAGDGIVRALDDGDGFDDDAAERWASALGDARERLAPNRGTVVLARAPRALAERFDPFGPAGPVRLRLMRGIKEALDPAGVLAPGRFLEEL